MFGGQVGEVKAVRTQPTQPKKFRVRYGILTEEWMGGCIEEITFGIRRVVMDSGGKVRSVCLECNIQKINRCFRYFRSEFNSWMEVAEQTNGIFKRVSGYFRYFHSVINVCLERLRKLTLICLQNQVLQVTQEKARIAGLILLPIATPELLEHQVKSFTIKLRIVPGLVQVRKGVQCVHSRHDHVTELK